MRIRWLGLDDVSRLNRTEGFAIFAFSAILSGSGSGSSARWFQNSGPFTFHISPRTPPSTMHIREATTEELQPWQGPGRETWGAVLCHGNRALGRVLLTKQFGELFAHGLEVGPGPSALGLGSSELKLGAAMLYLAARRKARAWGFRTCHVHFDSSSGEGMRDFWIRRMGARPVYEVYVVGIRVRK